MIYIYTHIHTDVYYVTINYTHPVWEAKAKAAASPVDLLDMGEKSGPSVPVKAVPEARSHGALEVIESQYSKMLDLHPIFLIILW